MEKSNQTLLEFLQSYKKVICFGAGSIFRIMCYELQQMGEIQRVLAVTDRSFSKTGAINIADISIPQITQEQAFERIQQEKGSIGILITTAAWMEVADYIKQNIEIDSYGVYSLLKVDTAFDIVMSEEKQNQLKIPALIHYCWFGKGEMSELIQQCVESWKRYCPGYQLKLWNEDNYDVENIAYTKAAYEQKKWAFVSDYVRMDVVYKYGGIYLDTDVELIKCLDEFRKNEGFIGTEVSGGINSGLGFGAIAGNRMVGELKKLYLKENIPAITNMGKETELFVQSGYQIGKGCQVINDITVYPWQVLSPKVKEDGSMHIGKHTYAIHHYDGSWLRT